MKTYICHCSILRLFSHWLYAQSWYPLGPGLNGAGHTIVPHARDVYVGGAFTNAGGRATLNDITGKTVFEKTTGER